MNKALHISITIIIILVTLAGYGIAVTVGNMTFINHITVWGGCIILSAIIGTVSWRIWRQITHSDTIWVNYALNIIVMTGILSGAIYGINLWGTGNTSPERVLTLPVERLVSETHYRTKRVGRRNVGQEPYLVYRAYILMPDSVRRHLDLRVEDFAKARRTDSVEVRIVRGALGADVIRSQKLKRASRSRIKHRRHLSR